MRSGLKRRGGVGQNPAHASLPAAAWWAETGFLEVTALQTAPFQTGSEYSRTIKTGRVCLDNACTM